jgi:hypothetical protein
LHRRPGITAAITVALASFSLSGVVASYAAPLASGALHGSSHLAGARNDTETSTNWAGFADETTSGRKFTYVMGTWVEPKATCTSSESHPYASFWVGIDGYSSSTVEQLGTDSDCSGKTPVYYAWWEMYPEGSINLSSSQYRVKPGDSLTASVGVSNGNFTLSLVSSEGWRFRTVRTGGSSLRQSSAEWIAEAPAIGNSTTPLAHFASFSFSRCEAATNNGSATAIASSNRTTHQLEMVSNFGTRMATASALSRTSNDFGLAWDHS